MHCSLKTGLMCGRASMCSSWPIQPNHRHPTDTLLNSYSRGPSTLFHHSNLAARPLRRETLCSSWKLAGENDGAIAPLLRGGERRGSQPPSDIWIAAHERPPGSNPAISARCLRIALIDCGSSARFDTAPTPNPLKTLPMSILPPISNN